MENSMSMITSSFTKKAYKGFILMEIDLRISSINTPILVLPFWVITGLPVKE
jgi:hypothetical protein